MEAEAVHYNGEFNEADFIDGEIPEETPAEAPKKPKDKDKDTSNWGLRQKQQLNREILDEIAVKLSKAYELMGNEYGRELLKDVAKELRKLILLNGLVGE